MDHIRIISKAGLLYGMHGVARSVLHSQEHTSFAPSCYNSITVLQRSNEEYSKKQEAGNATDKSMFKIVWDIKQLEDLNANGRQTT